MEQTGTSRAPIGAILAIAGGALLVVGSFLPWVTLTQGGVSESATGIDGSDGYVTVVAGLVALGAGIMMMRQTKRALAILALVAGLVGGGLGVYDALTVKDSIAAEVASQVGISVEEARVALDQGIEAGLFDISTGIGLYPVIGGGVVAVIGGLMSMKGSGSAGISGFAATSAPVPPVELSPASSMPETPPMTQPPPPPAEGGS